MKISELKAEAKRLGLRRYSRLGKAELIDLLRNQNPILDESVPDIDSSILKPTEYKPKPPPAATDVSGVPGVTVATAQKDEIRESEEMLGLRKKRKVIPEIKVTSPEELERETKIKKSRRLRK